MEEKRIENFIREFGRHMYWKKFRKGAVFGMLRFISFFMVLCCTGISLLYIIERRVYQIEDFSMFFLILFTSYAFLNTDFFVEKTIEGINVPEFEKYLEKEEYTGMEIDRKIIEEFLLNKEITEEVEEVTEEEAEEVIAAETIN
jgi:hypothetical protein